MNKFSPFIRCLLIVLLFIAALAFIAVKQAQVERVCFTFTFEGDLLDPGDELTFYGPVGIDGTGFMNVLDVPQQERTLCFTREANPGVIRILTNPNASITFKPEVGSVCITSVSVAVEKWRAWR